MGSTTTPNLQVLDFMTMCELVDYSFCTKVIRVSCTTLGAVVRLSGSLQCRNVTDSCDDYSAIVTWKPSSATDSSAPPLTCRHFACGSSSDDHAAR